MSVTILPIFVSNSRHVNTLTERAHKNTMLTVFRVGFIIFFHMVFGVNKNMDALIDSTLPREYINTNLRGLKLATAARYLAIPPSCKM